MQSAPNTDSPMAATIENMEAVAGAKDRSVFAYSFHTGEEYSADPADYFDAPAGWAMTDADGEPMFLVRRTASLAVVTADHNAEHAA